MKSKPKPKAKPKADPQFCYHDMGTDPRYYDAFPELFEPDNSFTMPTFRVFTNRRLAPSQMFELQHEVRTRNQEWMLTVGPNWIYALDGTQIAVYKTETARMGREMAIPRWRMLDILNALGPDFWEPFRRGVLALPIAPGDMKNLVPDEPEYCRIDVGFSVLGMRGGAPAWEVDQEREARQEREHRNKMEGLEWRMAALEARQINVSIGPKVKYGADEEVERGFDERHVREQNEADAARTEVDRKRKKKYADEAWEKLDQAEKRKLMQEYDESPDSPSLISKLKEMARGVFEETDKAHAEDVVKRNAEAGDTFDKHLDKAFDKALDGLDLDGELSDQRKADAGKMKL